MKCPNDNTTLQMSERSGIEIDYCPECRGVWLDRGELDKVIERAVPSDRPHVDDDHHHSGHHKHRKESLLGELFDF